MKIISLFIVFFLLGGLSARAVFAQQVVHDPKNYLEVVKQVESTIELLNTTQEQLDEAKKFTKNAINQVDNLKAIRGTLYHYYNNTFGIIGEAYRTYDKFKEVTEPNQYKKILDEYNKNLECLKTDMTDMMKMKNIFKTQYQFEEEENKKIQKKKIKNLFYAPGTNNNEFVSPYRNPSLSDQNLSSCGTVLDYARVRERKIKQYQGWLQMLNPDYQKDLAKAQGSPLAGNLLPIEVLKLRYRSMLATANCPDQDTSKCEGGKVNEIEINANDSEEVKREKELKNKYIRSLNERNAKTTASIAEDQLSMLMLIYETLNSMNEKMTAEFEVFSENKLKDAGELYASDLKKNLFIYGDVNGTSIENARKRDAAARDLGLQDLKSFNINLQ